MKAQVQYNDLTGTVAVDVSDFISVHFGGSYIESYGKYFKIDEDRFKVVGIEFNGTEHIFVSLICVDKQQSTPEKEYIVSMSIELPEEKNSSIIDLLFKRMNIVLYNDHDKRYSKMEIDRECNYEEFHN